MKFNEWWSKFVKSLCLSENGKIQLFIRELKDLCSEAYNDGIAEGLRRGGVINSAQVESPVEGSKQAQVARSDTTQGGGSQEASTEAPKTVPCQGGCPVRCEGCPRA